MTETERQFRAAGWKWRAESMYWWDHPHYPSVHLDIDIREQLMDMWLTGFVAGKEQQQTPDVSGGGEG